MLVVIVYARVHDILHPGGGDFVKVALLVAPKPVAPELDGVMKLMGKCHFESGDSPAEILGFLKIVVNFDMGAEAGRRPRRDRYRIRDRLSVQPRREVQNPDWVGAVGSQRRSRVSEVVDFKQPYMVQDPPDGFDVGLRRSRNAVAPRVEKSRSEEHPSELQSHC